jgi:HNH endonuclease/AP2 domain
MHPHEREQDSEFLKYLSDHFRLDVDGRTVWRLDRQTQQWASVKGREDGYTGVNLWAFKKTPVSVKLHRLVWFLHYGEFPTLDLDHIDRDKGNNHISNLREATKSENLRNCYLNQKSFAGSTSRYLGVRYVPDRKLFRADICVTGKHLYLGQFATEEEAARAHDNFIIKNGFTGRYKLNFPQV